ncbi:MAG: glycosyltransferase family 1 protein [Chloroflexota bacterium]
MRVGFDAHMVGQHETGNETYALGLLSGLDEIGFAVDTYAFAPTPGTIHRFHATWPHQSYIRIPITNPLLARRDRLNLFHATYVLPPVLPCRSVVTVHDITYALFPQWFAPRVRAMLQVLVPLALKKARRIITISEHTKRDLVQHYGVDPDKIAVAYLAPRPAFLERDTTSRREQPFFLYVGNVEPRKNVETVIRALAVMRDRKHAIPLVVTGKQGLNYGETVRLVHTLRLDHLVEFTGYVPDDRLRHLFASCTALVHPALYEGFGLTPLEAMVQRTPVIAANTSSVPEVVGDSALLVEAESIEAWTDAMENMMDSQDLREKYAERGAWHVTQFSWKRCAEKTLEAYRVALD